jgi:uncharacterized phage protein (TIGR01671 family)
MKGIKYRVWDKGEQKMCAVASIHFGDDGSALTIAVEPAPKGRYYRGLVEGENGILMQWTGLNDKNDTPIYEGDIVDVWSAGSHATGVIKWGNAGFFIQIPPPVAIWNLTGPDTDPCQVVGNIYEHIDLLPSNHPVLAW